MDEEERLYRIMLKYARENYESDAEAEAATQQAFALICDSPGCAERLASVVKINFRV